MIRKFLILCCVLILLPNLTGCAWFNTTTNIQMADGRRYEVNSKSDSVVEVTQGDVKIMVDNRGKLSGWELVFPAILQRTPTPDINIGGDD